MPSFNHIEEYPDHGEGAGEQQPDGFAVTLPGGHSVSLGSIRNQGKRNYQEDSCGFSNLSDGSFVVENGLLAVLSDGMGGLSNGKEVSAMAVNSMIWSFHEAPGSFTDGTSLRKTAEAINDAVCRRFCPDGRIAAGATLLAVMLRSDEMYWLSIGDSRIYLKRDGRLYQVNEDHDLLNRLLDGVIYGSLPEADAFSHPKKDTLVACIGNPVFIADQSNRALKLLPGDVVLLCSDGVYNALPLTELNGLLASDAQGSANRIERAVESYQFANQDNYTAIILSFQN